MAYQSLAMGEAFGEGFQFGKRRISAMTNEEFNKFTFKDMTLEVNANIKEGIPSMKRAMREFTTLQSEVIKELISYVTLLGPAISETAAEGGLDLSSLLKGIINIGGQTLTDTARGLAGGLLPEAEARRGGTLQTTGASPVQTRVKTKTGDVIDARLSAEILSKANKLAAENRARQQTLNEIRTKAAELALKKQVSRTGVVTSKRKAGQSQILERNNLIRVIAKHARDLKGTLSANRRRLITDELRKQQAKLTLLLQRYRF